MADWIIKLRIPEAKIDEYVAHYVYLHPNTQTIKDPNWVDPKDGSFAPLVLKYTAKQWVKEHIINYVRQQIEIGRNNKKTKEISAYNADDVK